MGIPQHGTYTSDDGVHKITIRRANHGNGQIDGDYFAASSPVGELSVPDMKGGFMWVNNKKLGRDGVAPFAIHFMAKARPDGRPYAIMDGWSGGYQEDDSLLLTGTRAFVSENGVVQSITLGTKVFSR